MKFVTTAFAVLLCSTLTFAQDKAEPSGFGRQIPPPLGPALQNDDDCNTATDAVAGQGCFAFDTTGTTTGAEGQNNAICFAFGSSGIDNDLWFSWTADADGNARVETCAQTTADTKLAVYDQGLGCPTADAIRCNDDDCGLQSGVDFPVLNGETYLVQLGSFPGATGGTGNICFTISEPPQILENDDDCNTADDAISGQGCWAFDTSGATTGAEGQNNAICFAFGSSGIDNDIWFSWTADDDGNARIETCGTTSVDTKIAVYDQGLGCPSADAIRCNDDDCGLQSGVNFPVLTGETYLVQLGTFPGALGGAGEVCFSITEPPEPPCGYASDTGSSASEGSLGLTAGGEVVMHKRFSAAGGDDQIKGVSCAFGSPAFAPNINNGAPVTIAIYNDANGDGDPSGEALLYLDETQVVANADTDIFNDFVVSPNVVVSGDFILAVGVVQAAGQFPLPMDDVEPGGTANWVAGATGGVYNYAAPEANDVAPLNMAAIGFDNAFLLRGSSNGTNFCDGFIGENYCGPGTANSSGTPGGILATGSDVAADENVTLLAYNVPPGNVCLFIASANQGLLTPPRSCGPICLMGPDIARFKFDAQVIDDGGKCSLTIDPFVVLTNPPQPIMAGQTWNFQAWHRDSGAGPDCNNNFTDAVSITFN